MYSTSEYSPEDIELVRKYLNEYAALFTYIFHEHSELAFKINHNVMDSLAEIRDFWYTNTLRSFNSSIRELQDHIANNIVGILSIYELNMYDWVGNYISFDKSRFSHSILQQKEEEAKCFVEAIAGYYKQLQEIAIK
jgi:hypothetical protein